MDDNKQISREANNQLDQRWAEQEIDRLREENRQLRRSQSQPMGCVCPPGANLSCANPTCPRRNWGNVAL